MASNKRWLLPDGIDELLPERAASVEALRRALLDDCARWGYRYVIPPLVEFTDSLLVGLGADLDVLTCKFSDRTSGRMLGVRADITPQVARIDAHALGEEGVTRLCYSGSTLHSAPQSTAAGRSPIQLGAELYGCADISADLEVIDLMLALMSRADMQERHGPITLDVGHVGVYQAVLRNLGIEGDAAGTIFDALQRKSLPDLDDALATSNAEVMSVLRSLVNLHGGPNVLEQARICLSSVPEALTALDEVEQVIQSVQALHPSVSIYVDLAELRGFQYHTGLVFAAYLDGVGTAVATGGRYDNVGAVFGRSRSATGFAFDLKALIASAGQSASSEKLVSAPNSKDVELLEVVRRLRATGRSVVTALGGIHDPRCCEVLVKGDDGWEIQPLNPGEINE
jgi:ATP phosphoribosyltransferase regulatory subunit